MLEFLIVASNQLKAGISGDFYYREYNHGLTIDKYSGKAGNVVIPDKIDWKPVTFTGKKAFFDLTGFKVIFIPESVTVIEPEVFKGCTGLIITGNKNSRAEQYESDNKI